MGILGPRSFRCSCALAAGAAIVLALPAVAATIRVPAEEPTIQAGIDAAIPGDLVLVAPGIYTGAGNKNLDLRGKAVTLASESGPEATVIDCEGSGRAILMFRGETAATAIDGFTFRRGDGAGEPTGGGAVLILAASPTFSRCIFAHNTAIGRAAIDGGGGAAACFGSTARFETCIFTGNTAVPETPGHAGHGGAVSAHISALTFLDCRFDHNRSISGEGGAIFTVAIPPAGPWSITGCTFRYNKAVRGGALSVIELNPGATVSDCTFANNAAVDAGAVEAATLHLVNCVIAGNTAERSAGGVSLNDGSLTGCVLAGNTAGQSGGGLACHGMLGSVSATGCTIVGNAAPLAGSLLAGARCRVSHSILAFGLEGAAVGGDRVPTFSCSNIYGHAGGDWVGRIAKQLGEDGNITADPWFCDRPADLRLCADSPCAAEYSGDCGLIGALPVGCPPCGATAATPSSWGRIKHRYRE